MRWLLALLAILPMTRPADACTPIGPLGFELDPAHVQDHTPPSAVVASGGVQAFEARGTCGAIGHISLLVEATDDATPIERLGYRIARVGGDLPLGPVYPDPVSAYNGTRIVILFDPDGPAFAVDLEIRAVDLNGNEGPPTVVPVTYEPAAGCSAGGSSSSLMTLALLGLLRRRRVVRATGTAQAARCSCSSLLGVLWRRRSPTASPGMS